MNANAKSGAHQKLFLRTAAEICSRSRTKNFSCARLRKSVAVAAQKFKLAYSGGPQVAASHRPNHVLQLFVAINGGQIRVGPPEASDHPSPVGDKTLPSSLTLLGNSAGIGR